MSHYPKTTIFNEDWENHVVQKMYIVGEPGRCLNYIGRAKDVANHNQRCSSTCYGPPIYFSTYAEARACAKFWNKKVPWEYDQSELVRRHGMNCAFVPHLVKVIVCEK